MPEIVALFGPTGVGKTEVAIALAERLRSRGELPVAVSADALQVYCGLETITGAASAAERARLEHRLISFLPVDATFSAGQYAQLAHAEIDELLAQGRRPIVVGGTGLYLRAALTELSLRPAPAEGARERWTAELELRGPAALHATLAAGELEPHDGPSELWTDAVRHPTLLIGLVLDRQQLYARIDARVDWMVAAGAEREVRAAHVDGASATARKALGFEELLAGDIEGMKRHTRNYARRQLTWMRKLAGASILDTTGRGAEQVADEVLRLVDHRLSGSPA